METGSTALSLQVPAPGITYLYGLGLIRKGMRVLDYGAGFGRNAAYLRRLGVDVYAYDPYHADMSKGRIFRHIRDDRLSDYRVSDNLPEGQFDVSFTCYVLCVVPKHEQDRIVDYLESVTRQTQYHIVVPPQQLKKRVEQMVTRKSQPTWAFYQDIFGGPIMPTFLESTMDDFCAFGVQTSRGFQRAVHPNMSKLRMLTRNNILYQETPNNGD